MQFTTSSPSLAEVVELPDDSGTPAAILFDIVHGRFRMVPSKIATLDALYQVLSFADKYDMISLLVPWIQEWVSSVPPLQEFLFGGGPTAWTIWKAVAVSRELGALCPLKELLRRIIMTTGIDSSGKLLWAEYPLEFMGSQEMPLSSPEIFGKWPQVLGGQLHAMYVSNPVLRTRSKASVGSCDRNLHTVANHGFGPSGGNTCSEGILLQYQTRLRLHQSEERR